MQPSTRNWIIGGGIAIAAAAWYISSFVTSADVRTYGSQCRDWISKDIADGAATSLGDHWKKRGKLVFEVLVPKKDKGSYSVYLCVVDKTKGTMVKPSAFDTSWD